ncbi:MAG: DUF5106 domain-containing protein [Flavobacteriales bacterium]|nr:DUF5106 domain-containing protein [Flavobacteriales bacterium]
MIRALLIIPVFIFSAFFSFAVKKETKTKSKFYFEFNVADAEEDSMIILANYYGLKQYYYDTAFMVTKGKYIFETDSMPGGIYMGVTPDKAHFFEIMFDGKEPRIVLSTSKLDMLGSMKIQESAENKLFYEFQLKMEEYGKKAQPFNDKLKELKEDSVGNNEAEIKAVQEDLSRINDEVIAYKREFIEAHKGTFVAKVFATSQEPDVPENPVLPDSVDINTWKYYFFRDHYFDQVDFTDERLLRSPTLAKKIEYYITKLVPQIPDSINEAADMMAKKAKPNKEVFKYVVHWITNNYERSKIMGMDAVFVHMADEYYCTEEGAYWVDSAATAKICERASSLRPLLIGATAENIILPDTNMKWHNMHKLEAEVTILVFWSPTCGHCKKTVPLLEPFYQENKNRGVEIFSVSTELETENLKTFIKSNKLSFINVSDTPEINKNAYEYISKGLTTLNSLNFRTIYDIFSTPQVYILDKDKKIIAKKLGIEQLQDFLDNYFKEKNKG